MKPHPLTVGIRRAMGSVITAGRIAEVMAYARSADKAVAETSVALRGVRRGVTSSTADGVSNLPRKPKRIRVRSPKVYACDLETGGVYVPKRGNDKTPNFVITATYMPRGSDVAVGVNARKVNESIGCERHYTADEFLALVSRRVEA